MKINDKSTISIKINDPPDSFILSSDTQYPGTDGRFNLNWTDSNGADNYSIYSYSKNIIQLNGSLMLINYQNATSPYKLFLYPTAYEPVTVYYVVVAHNESGYTLSNCVSVISATVMFFILEPWLLFIVLGGLGGFAIIYTIYKRITD